MDKNYHLLNPGTKVDIIFIIPKFFKNFFKKIK